MTGAGPVAGLLAGRTAIVTGAARGIGLEIARLLSENGARVALADRDADEAAAAAAGLGDERSVWSYGCDVTDEAQVDALVTGTVERFGSLDIFVNNAGITRDASLKKMTVQDFDAVITVHLRGTWLGVRAASAVMREAGSGSIVNILPVGEVRQPGPDQLQRGQGRHRRSHQGRGQGTGTPRRPGQRRAAGPHQDRDDRGHAARGLRRTRGRHPDEAGR